MKIAVFNGSPRKQNTAAMVDAFCEGAVSAGHEVEIYHVGRMNIAPCKGCEYCHTKGEGRCIQKDDFEKILPAYLESDMIVFASPIYYFTMTAQMEAAIQRVYCIGKPQKAKKAALLLSMGSGGYESAITQFEGYTSYTGIENAGVFTAAGDVKGDKEKLDQIRKFASAL